MDPVLSRRNRGAALFLLPVGAGIVASVSSHSAGTGVAVGVGIAAFEGVVLGIAFVWDKRLAREATSTDQFAGGATIPLADLQLAEPKIAAGIKSRRVERWFAGQLSGRLLVTSTTWRWMPDRLVARAGAVPVEIATAEITGVTLQPGIAGIGGWLSIERTDHEPLRMKVTGLHRLAEAVKRSGHPPLTDRV